MQRPADAVAAAVLLEVVRISALPAEPGAPQAHALPALLREAAP